MASNKSSDQSSSSKRHRDKSYRHIFKGSVLINTLLDYDDNKFSSRQTAVRFAQRLLDIGQIESIVDGDKFEDSVSLFRWCDESVLREAKKINTSSTTTAHIPKRRIIELIDLHQAEDTDEAYSVDKAISRLTERSNDQQQQAPYDSNNNSHNRNINNNNPEFRHHSAEDNSHRSRDLSYEEGDHHHLKKGRLGHSDENLYGIDYDADPLAAWADNVLENDDRYNEVDDFDRQTSYDSDVFNSNTNDEDKDISSSSVVRYDGIDMPAIDLENINFATMVGQLQNNTAQYSNMGELLDYTTQEGSSFSDNEKQLLQQMRKMQDEHQNTVDGYEERISELMDRISELKSLAELLEKQQKETSKKKETTFTSHGDISTTSTPVPVSNTPHTTQPPNSTAPLPPPPPPAPPPLPPSLNATSSSSSCGVVKPNKRPVKPRVKMRPLFWNRVILENDNEETFWHYATEPNFDVDEFERLFGRDPAKEKKPKKSLHETIAGKKTKDIAPSKQQKVKLLEENRSRAVAIKLRSMHCDLVDIKNAVFKMDFSKLDVEKLYGLYEVKGTAEEMAMITQYLEDNPEAKLDEPEAFLVEMSKMSQFSERIECLMFRKTLNESVFDIDQQLDIVQQACKAIHSSQSLRTVMEIVLAFGNYMNGGTQRGQADGFDLEVLSKLKDVKSIDNSTTLLRHIVHVNTKENEAFDAGKNEAIWRFPDATLMTQASNISFHEVTKELNKLKLEIRSHSRKADIVCLNSKESLLQPFKDQMDDFFDSADTMLKGQFEKLEATQDMYNDVLKYLAVKDNQGKMGTDTFFATWAQLLDDYKKQWKREQKEIAKQMFEKVETHRKERMRTAKRRKSIVEDGKSNLKQRFTLMRQKKSDGIANTVKLLRSQSMTGVDVATAEESTETTTDTSEQPHHNKYVSGTSESTSEKPVKKHSRVRSRIREQNKATIRRSNSSASLQRNGESMIERMQQRRRSRIEGDESQMTSSNQTLNETSNRERSRRTGVTDTNVMSVPSAQSQMSRIGARLSQQAEMSSSVTGTTDTIKERMQRRRREREAAVNKSSNSSTTLDTTLLSAIRPPTSNPPRLMPAKSIDLSTLRSRFKSDESPLRLQVNEVRQALTRKTSSSITDLKDTHSSTSDDHTNCDHPTCMAQRMTKAAVRANSGDRLSVSNNNLKSSVSRLHGTRASASELRNITSPQRQEDKGPVYRRRRESVESSRTSLAAETESSKARRSSARDNWKGSQQSLPDSDSTPSRKVGTTRSRLGSKDGWRGSHQSLVEGSDGSPATRETRSSILRREAAARANQRLSTENKSPGTKTMRDLRTGLHSSQPSLSDAESKLSVSKRRSSVDRDSSLSHRSNRERRGSHQSDSSDNGSSTATTKGTVFKRSKDTWRGSHQSLNSDNDTSSTKANTSKRSGNKSLSSLRGTSQSSSTEEKSQSRRGTLKQTTQTENNEKENKDVLRRVSRSRTNLVTK